MDITRSDSKEIRGGNKKFETIFFLDMNRKIYKDIPPQELKEKWFKSHLLGKEIELRELYELPQDQLDLVMAETAEFRSDIGNRDRNIGKFCTAGYFLELSRIIDKRRASE